MKRILMLEDDLELLDYTAPFEKNGFEIIKCASIELANEALMEKKNIKLICTDLNLSTKGLTPSETKQSFGSRLAGWIWLKNYVYKDEKNKNIKYVIRSAFVSDLKEYLLYSEDDYEKNLFHEDACFQKNTNDNEIIAYIKKLLRMD